MIATITSSLGTIPIIDFQPFLLGDDREQRQVARQLYQACHEIGFMYVQQIGIDRDLVAAAFHQSHRFFALPLTAKQALAYPDAFSNRGYAGIERERLDPNQPGDLKETFNLGLDGAESPDVTNPALTQNCWPPGDEEFRSTLVSLFAACTMAANQLLQAFALALNLPPSFLVDRHHNQEHTLRLLHYPPLQQPPKPGQIRAGEHSDYGSITLLFQDQMGGLEVQTTQGDWIAAPAIPDTVLVNTGNIMQRWSNDVFRSTRHRVAVPSCDRAHLSRYAIAFFCQPDHNAEISCIPECQGPEHSAKYPPILAGDYLVSLLQATY